MDSRRIKEQTWLRHVEVHTALPSTNSHGIQLARDPRTETPALIVALEQTAGRGRGTNSWWSGPGALTFTVVFDAEDFQLAPERWPRIALCAAVAVCDLLRESAPRVQVGIKWPNDVWLSGRKVCGILVEPVPPTTGQPARIVLGVGLNVNNSMASAPDEIQRVAAALCDECKQHLDTESLLVRLINRIQECLQDLGADDDAQLRLATAWQTASVLTGRLVTLRHGEELITGECQGIASDGSLLLAAPEGTVRNLYAGTVVAIE